MNLTEFFVRNRPFTIVVTLCLVLVGVASFLSVPRSEDPSLKIPAFNVIIVNPGVNPLDLERLVARPIEDSVKELDDLRKIETTIRDGLVIVAVEFIYGTDPEKKYDDVVRQVGAIRDRLPSGIVRQEIRKVQTIDVALMQVALVSPDASYARLQDLAEALRKRFEAIPGVRKSEKWAYPDKQVRVTVNPDRLAQYQIPAARVIGMLQGNNANLPGGSAELGGRRMTIKTTGNFQTLDEVRRTPIAGTGAATVFLGDVAEIEWAYEELNHIGRFRGERSVFVTALPQKRRSAPELQAALKQAVTDFRGQLPGDVRLEIGFDQADNVALRLNRLEHDFLIAFALVLLTVLPLGWRASLLVMVSIPLSLAMGVALLEYTGYSLNQLSIVGCVIALGLLVDDSIVVVENIARFRREGYPPLEAAIAATRQIAVAVLGTTATLLFAFLPLLMLPGGAGQFIRSLPLAVVYTVLASLLVSLTIVPFLASRFLTGKEDPEGNVLLRGLHRAIHITYRPLLHWAMTHRVKTLLFAGVLFFASLALVPRIGFSLFPKAGTPQFSIRIYGAEGNSLEATDGLVRAVETVLAGTPEIAWWFANVGRGNPQIYYNEIPEEQSARIGDVFCALKEFDPITSPAVFARLREQLGRLPGARILVKEFENGPPIAAPIAIRVMGEDLAVLRELAAQVEQILRDTPGTDNVDNPLKTLRTDLRVRLDKAKAALLGVSELDVDQLTRLAFAGFDVTKFRESDGDEYNITLSLSRGDRATMTNWSRLSVPTASGAWVPMSQVARLELESAPPLVQRYNRERTITLTSHVRTGDNTDRLTRAVEQRLRALAWPPGYRFQFGGEVESRQESFGGLGQAVLIATFGILAILVLEFRSFRGTLVVASVIPLGVVGGLAGLFLTGYTLSFTASIGFIALIGIEIKNSILLVDFTNQLREQGVALDEAIERAGEIRFLPVVLTTLTAIGALLPLAFARSGMYSPLAVVIIGGLISSLLLSRLVTPVMYSLLPPPKG
jgi:multidrug efflux pump subunit AcrB